MLITKKTIIPAVAATAIIGAVGLYGTHAWALADSSSSASHQTLAQRIAAAFNLDPTKVQTVITQYRTGNQTKRADNYEQRLQAAVTAGKLTAAQEQAILTEHNTLAAQTKAALAQTGTDRRTALQKIRSDAQAWAKSNNISVRWLLGPRPMRGGHGQFSASTAAPSTSPTPSPSASPGI